MNEKTIKNWQRVALGVVIAFMALATGYSSFAQTVAYMPATSMPGDSMWDIGFIDAKLVSKTAGTVELDSVKYDKIYGCFNVRMSGQGDSILYEFTIKNRGKLDAEVKDIYLTGISDNSSIIFSTSGINRGDVLKAGDTVKVNVSAKYNPNHLNNNKYYQESATVVIDYIQHND